MKLRLLNDSEIPPISNEEEEDDNDMEQIRKDIDFRKKFVHRPQQAMAGELNKDMHTPVSPTSFSGAAPTR